MTSSYLVRLVLLASASFFVAQVILQAIAAWLAPKAIGRAMTMNASRAAQAILTLRLLPTALSAIIVAILCVPSYLRFEPAAVEEEAGFACVLAALLGCAIVLLGIWRAVSATARTSQFVSQCGGAESCVEGTSIWIVRGDAGIALAGLRAPRILVSERAMRELSSDQLSAAVRHELAHRDASDNFKRLLILLTPALFPQLRTLEKAWAQVAEWTADDRAAAGDADFAVTLASALVRLARIPSSLAMPPLAASLIEADEDISLRVSRLLEARPVEKSTRYPEMAAATAVAVLFSLAFQPAVQRAVHRLLEILLD